MYKTKTETNNFETVQILMLIVNTNLNMMNKLNINKLINWDHIHVQNIILLLFLLEFITNKKSIDNWKQQIFEPTDLLGLINKNFQSEYVVKFVTKTKTNETFSEGIV